MIANLDKFQAIVLSKTDSLVTHELNIYDSNIETTKSVKLLGIELDHQLNLINTYQPYIPRQQCN